MNILSLFDGISCAQLALKRAKIPISLYLASEIDKYAIKVTQRNFPKTVQLGDITKINAATLPKIDLLIGGSPCTSLSCAKRQKESGLEKGESTLFWEYVRVLRTVNPRYFLLENVASMKKTDRAKISEIMGCEPILIDSALVSAQQRKRLYWTNIPVNGLPKDKGIKLQDILENGAPNKSLGEKAYALTAGYAGCKLDDDMYPRTSVAMQEKSYALVSTYNRACPRDFFEKSQRTLIYTVPRGFNKGGEREAEKFPTLTSNSCEQNNLIVLKKHRSQSQRIYDPLGKSCTLNANGGAGGAKTGLYKIGKNVRKLTPTECEILQTIPRNYTAGISDTQRYRCLGNGFTVDVIVHILSFLPKTTRVVEAIKSENYQFCFE